MFETSLTFDFDEQIQVKLIIST